MLKERAEKIWSQRGIQNTLDDSLFEPGEREEIVARWEQMPGTASFMDAFFTFLHPTPQAVVYTDHELRAEVFRPYIRS
jgi:hypothetical protein